MACAKCKSEGHETSEHASATNGESNWIGKAIKHPGALHRDLGVEMGKPIPEAKLTKAVKGGYGKKTAARARFAKQLHGFHSSK